VRASGLQGDSSGEIIELLDEETDAFDARAPSLDLHDRGGRRWIGSLAAVALAGVIVYGVATSSSSRGAPDVVVTPTTRSASRPTPTGRPLPAATNRPDASAFPVPYYAAEPPRPYKVQQVGIQLADSGAYYGADGYQLWATDGASASSGRWLSLQAFQGASDFHVPDAFRVETDKRPVALARTPAGQTIANFAIDRSASVTLTSFGITDDEVAQLAGSIDVVNGRVQLGDTPVLDGYRMISSVTPWLAIQGVAIERVYYAPVSDLTSGVRIAVGLPAVVNDGDITLDRQAALRFFLDSTTSFAVDKHPAVAGAVVGQDGYSVASWTNGNHIVTLSGMVSVAQIIDIARTVHEVTSAEWEGMKFQASRNTSEVDRLYRLEAQAQPTPVSSGIDDRGDDWSIQAAVASFGNQHQITWMWNEHGDTSWTSIRDNTVGIHPVVGADRTYVLADLPRSIAAAAELRVTRPGLDPVVVPFTDIDPSLDRTFAAYVFSQPGPYGAEIVGADGAVLATWPSASTSP